ncbi:hypothetical protein Tco_0973659 [Tanacetum coccineum]
MQMVEGNRGNQFRQYVGQNNVGNQNGLIVVPEIANPNGNQVRNGNVVAARAEGIQLQAEEFDFIDKAPVYDSDGSAEYTDLLEPISEPHQVQQNDSDVISAVSSMEQGGGGTVEQNDATIEETRALYDSLYNNLAIEVDKVDTVNRKMKETNAELKNQEKSFEINKEKYDKLERCYQKSVYQEQCLTKKINALYLSSAKTITTLNEEIVNLNNQLSKGK